jgi:hypothetical protein
MTSAKKTIQTQSGGPSGQSEACQAELACVPSGTRVLNTEDGEPGVIVNGFAFDAAAGGWTEYEVETAYGIERWGRSEFVLMSELEAAAAETA